MSFSSDAKAELCRVPLTRRCCARAEAYGVLLYAGSFSPTEVRIVTESEDFAARLPKLFQKAFGVRFDAQESGSKSIFRITDGQKLAVILEALGYDPDQHYALHVNFALLEEECCRASFLRGAFLAGGSVTDPLKRYHLELATPHLQAGREVEALLAREGIDLGQVGRNADVLVQAAGALADVGAYGFARNLLGAAEATLRDDAMPPVFESLEE